MTPEEREELEHERDFLLRSLDDLDDELKAGNIDPDNYRTLHDDYTARAAAVIKTLDDGVERKRPQAPRVSRVMRTITFAGIGVFIAVAAVLLAHNAGERSPGQTITGNAQSRTTLTLDPNSYEGHMQAARTALQSSNYPEAIRQYNEASQVDPTQGEPLAYSGWITALVARSVGDQATKNELLGKAREQLDQAINVAPDFPDSYVFEGLLLSRIENHPCDAVTRFQKFLVLAPADHPMRNDVLAALQNAIQTGKCPGASPTTTVKQ